MTSSRPGFTLIELILVLALVAIAASLSAPRLASFFRGRALDQEARRLLSLTRYGQSRAVTEGVPVRLWLDPAGGRYGLEIESGYRRDDPRAVTYETDRDVTLEIIAASPVAPYEDEGQPAPRADRLDGILFLPDGLMDAASVSRVVLRQGQESALDLTATADGLAYELLPHDDRAPR